MNIKRFITVMIIITLPLVAVADVPVKYQIADLKAIQNIFIELADAIKPSVVTIQTHTNNTEISDGSGFIIDKNGYIVTNRHVVIGSDLITVILHTGIKYKAKIIQTDARSDLAVIKIGGKHLQTVRIGDSTKLRVNQWIFVCGNPLGLAEEDGNTSVTYGVVSALGRDMTQELVGDSNIEYYGDMIEISAAINPGNSGGPMFDIDGKVVGIITANNNMGLGFSIPMNKNTRRIINTLKTGNVVKYGFIGAVIKDVDSGTMIVDFASANSPAVKAGLKIKDTIIEYNSIIVKDSDHLIRLIGATTVGEQVQIKFIRNGINLKTTIVVGDRNKILVKE